MKTKTHVRAGGRLINHNETLVRDKARVKGLKVKTHVKGGRGGVPDPGPRP
jgi:hypothetical protein